MMARHVIIVKPDCFSVNLYSAQVHNYAIKTSGPRDPAASLHYSGRGNLPSQTTALFRRINIIFNIVDNYVNMN